jgi:protein-S-isoprenylcysteine O-methyltransferase Ste14
MNNKMNFYGLYQSLLVLQVILIFFTNPIVKNSTIVIGFITLLVSAAIILYWEMFWQKNQGLVIKGLYKYVRHPFLTGMIILFIGITITFFSIYSLILTLISIIIIFYGAIKEDKEISKKFPKYKDYTKKVKFRFFPGLF